MPGAARTNDASTAGTSVGTYPLPGYCPICTTVAGGKPLKYVLDACE